jgi:hypothetical protein
MIRSVILAEIEKNPKYKKKTERKHKKRPAKNTFMEALRFFISEQY